jgi:hypothetical protein
VVKNEHRKPKRVLPQSGSAQQTASGELEDFDYLLPRNAEPLRYFVDSGSRFEILEHSGNRHASIAKYPRATQSSRDAFYRRTLRPIESCHILACSNFSILVIRRHAVLLQGKNLPLS